jgi:hypothetical protein
MARNRGQIPKYGKHFRLESTGYHSLANRIYVLKTDERWFIRSDKTSKVWQIYHGIPRDRAIAMSTPLPSLGQAMTRLLQGIELGFYQAVTHRIVTLTIRPVPPDLCPTCGKSGADPCVTRGARYYGCDHAARPRTIGRPHMPAGRPVPEPGDAESGLREHIQLLHPRMITRGVGDARLATDHARKHRYGTVNHHHGPDAGPHARPRGWRDGSGVVMIDAQAARRRNPPTPESSG